MSLKKKRAAPKPPQLEPVPGSSIEDEENERSPSKPQDLGDSNDNTDMVLKIIMPDQTANEITISPSMALMDLRMQLCAKYKLSPSSYMIQPINIDDGQPIPHQPSNTIGSLSAKAVAIKSKTKVPIQVAPPKVVEPTVRLTIKMSQSNHQILRVSPNKPLAKLMPQILEKSGLKADKFPFLELRHPEQNTMALETSRTLNDYKIKEIYLADKRASQYRMQQDMVYDQDKEPTTELSQSGSMKRGKKLKAFFRLSKKQKHAAPIPNATSKLPTTSPTSSSPPESFKELPKDSAKHQMSANTNESNSKSRQALMKNKQTALENPKLKLQKKTAPEPMHPQDSLSEVTEKENEDHEVLKNSATKSPPSRPKAPPRVKHKAPLPASRGYGTGKKKAPPPPTEKLSENDPPSPRPRPNKPPRKQSVEPAKPPEEIVVDEKQKAEALAEEFSDSDISKNETSQKHVDQTDSCEKEEILPSADDAGEVAGVQEKKSKAIPCVQENENDVSQVPPQVEADDNGMEVKPEKSEDTVIPDVVNEVLQGAADEIDTHEKHKTSSTDEEADMQETETEVTTIVPVQGHRGDVLETSSEPDVNSEIEITPTQNEDRVFHELPVSEQSINMEECQQYENNDIMENERIPDDDIPEAISEAEETEENKLESTVLLHAEVEVVKDNEEEDVSRVMIDTASENKVAQEYSDDESQLVHGEKQHKDEDMPRVLDGSQPEFLDENSNIEPWLVHEQQGVGDITDVVDKNQTEDKLCHEFNEEDPRPVLVNEENEQHLDSQFGQRSPKDGFDFMYAESEELRQKKSEETNGQNHLSKENEKLADSDIDDFPPPPPPEELNEEHNVMEYKKDSDLDVADDDDETVHEIEKLRAQINRMRRKKMQKEAARQKPYTIIEEKRPAESAGFKAGSKTFTFVPNQQKKLVYEDYEVAPSVGISLSKSGEIRHGRISPDTEDDVLRENGENSLEAPENETTEAREQSVISNSSPPVLYADQPVTDSFDKNSNNSDTVPVKVAMDEKKEEKPVNKQGFGGYVTSAALKNKSDRDATPELSNSIQKPVEKDDSGARKSTLPNYYKRFLGMQALMSVRNEKQQISAEEKAPVVENAKAESKAVVKSGNGSSSQKEMLRIEPVSQLPLSSSGVKHRNTSTPSTRNEDLQLGRGLVVEKKLPSSTIHENTSDIPPPMEKSNNVSSVHEEGFLERKDIMLPPPPEEFFSTTKPTMPATTSPNDSASLRSPDSSASSPPVHSGLRQSYFGVSTAKPFSSSSATSKPKFRPMSASFKGNKMEKSPVSNLT